MRKFIYALPLIVLILCATPVFANYSPFPNRMSMSTLPPVLLLDYASDLFFIMLSLLIFKQAGKIRLSKIMFVSIIALIAGFMADGIGIQSVSSGQSTYNMSSDQFYMSIVISVPLIALANFLFAIYFFELNFRQSLIMGLIVGIFTMPGGVLLASNMVSPSSSLPNYNDAGHLYTYAQVGTIFAAADVILLLLMKPITSLNRASVGALGLVIAAGASWYCLGPVTANNNEYEEISTCSSRMRIFAMTIVQYANLYGDYPSDISAIPIDYFPKLEPREGYQLKGLEYMYCKLDKDRSGITSYEYRKPPASVCYPAIVKIIYCPKHDLPPLRDACDYHLDNMNKKLTRYRMDHGKLPDSVEAVIDAGICGPDDLYCPYVDSNGKKVRYTAAKPSPDAFGIVNKYLRLECPIHQPIPKSVECKKRRNDIFHKINDSYPSSLDQIKEEMDITCPSSGDKPIYYKYSKPTDSYEPNHDYWMLKCTHHPKYDLYQSVDGMSMKGLPKGESYK